MYINTTKDIIAHNWAFVFFVIMAFSICGIMLLGGWLLGGKSLSRNKNTQFESGIVSVGDAHLRLSIKFYLVAIFFLIFDVETLFLYSWAISIKECGWIGFIEALIFIIMLLFTLIYLIRTGIMEWIPKNKKL